MRSVRSCPACRNVVHTSHPLVYRIFESFLAAGCPNATTFPHKTAVGGMKPFLDRPSAHFPKKYSNILSRPANARSVSSASSSSVGLILADSTSPLMTQLFSEGARAVRSLDTRVVSACPMSESSCNCIAMPLQLRSKPRK